MTPEQKSILRTSKCAKLSDADFEYFCTVCERTGLDPFTSQIHAVTRFSQGREVMSIQVGIDGFRLQAQRSGQYEGQTGPHWCGDDGAWKDIWLSKAPPVAARVGVWRTGFREPLWGSALWEEYKQEGRNGLSPMWSKMGALMLGKVAEALALRRAFPAELSGLYVNEEMHQADKDEPAAKRQPAPSPAPEPKAAPVSMATPQDVRNLSDALSSARIVEKEGKLNWIGDRVGRKVETSKELTSHEARALVALAITESLFPVREGKDAERERAKAIALYIGKAVGRMVDRVTELTDDEVMRLSTAASAGEGLGEAKGAA